ncbi:MAG: tetratricopeptide repeat protein [Anaerolinea sp.]|nr:tetratricopeptide repeat protein [Anaerolinea sp.]MCC6975621.1 tetratricopeptide repeat protein [Anaerolineae bacterium]CAG0963191.1 hypothetical protein ANRL4_00794 [Anaerolineae bacterium]
MFKRMWSGINQFITWLGVGRTRFLFFLLAVTGLGSLMLNAVHPAPEWVAAVQSVLAAGFLIGAAITVITRFAPQDRRQVMYLMVPAVAALVIGLLFPSITVLMFFVAGGWMVIGSITLRSRVRREYQSAIKHLRKGEYDQAIEVMTDLIKAESDQADHYRFRAELFRLSGKVKRAKSDYERVIALSPQSGVGYNGLAEVLLQTGDFEGAMQYAHKALEMEPNQWVPAYNLGMIEDRLGHWSEVVVHLKQALEAGIPDSRHRMLAYLWTARACHHLNDTAGADEALERLKHEKGGLREWRQIFESEEAAVLREVLTADVELAEGLAEGKLTLDSLKVG